MDSYNSVIIQSLSYDLCTIHVLFKRHAMCHGLSTMSQAVEAKVEGLQKQKGQDTAFQAALAARGLGGNMVTPYGKCGENMKHGKTKIGWNMGKMMGDGQRMN